jgi:hypothetical protein
MVLILDMHVLRMVMMESFHDEVLIKSDELSSEMFSIHIIKPVVGIKFVNIAAWLIHHVIFLSFAT